MTNLRCSARKGSCPQIASYIQNDPQESTAQSVLERRDHSSLGYERTSSCYSSPGRVYESWPVNFSLVRHCDVGNLHLAWLAVFRVFDARHLFFLTSKFAKEQEDTFNRVQSTET